MMDIGSMHIRPLGLTGILRDWIARMFFKRSARATVACDRADIWLPSSLQARVDSADQMLRDWACDRDRSDQAHGDRLRLVGWLLSDADRAGLHLIVEGWNWEHGLRPMEWISLNPETTRATALQLFWRLEPAQYVKYIGEEELLQPYQVRAFKILKEIKMLLEEGFYHDGEPGGAPGDPVIAYSPPPEANQVDMRNSRNQALYPYLAFEKIKGEAARPKQGAGRCPYDYS